MNIQDIPLGKKVATGIEIPLPEAPLVLAVGKKGFIMCDFLSLDAAEGLRAACAVVRGARDLKELLEGEIWGASARAQQLGVKPGITGAQALKKFL